MTLSEKLYLTADRKSVVREGDPSAAFLLGVPGTVISDATAKRLGLLKDNAPNQPVTQDPDVETRDPEITNRDGRRSKKHK
jgi:hypothetical protein